MNNAHISFIGSAGVPNRYGGFEAFLEQCSPYIADLGLAVTVTCDASLYVERGSFGNVNRVFVPIKANGARSIVHDLLAFLLVFVRSSHIVVLGVSGGVWFPAFRVLCSIFAKRLIVNIDGVEWQRGKFGKFRKIALRLFDGLAQVFAHHVVYDNDALRRYLIPSSRDKSSLIPYSGDHVLRLPNVHIKPGTALTICRIEPENNIELLLDAAIVSSINEYTVVGNWNKSAYGLSLRDRYRGYSSVKLLDPIYDTVELAELRGSCEYYLHGHSVGGTNPSLVEMLFYDCNIFCLDVAFHRHTAGDSAKYFKDVSGLVALLNDKHGPPSNRDRYRALYSRRAVVEGYLRACRISF